MPEYSEKLFNQIVSINRMFQTRPGTNGFPMSSLLDKDRLLIILSRYPDGLRLKDLAVKAHISLPTASKLISKQSAWVICSIGSSDRRERVFTLSESGKHRVSEIADAWNDYVAKCFGTLTPDEQGTLSALLDKVLAGNKGSLSPMPKELSPDTPSPQNTMTAPTGSDQPKNCVKNLAALLAIQSETTDSTARLLTPKINYLDDMDDGIPYLDEGDDDDE